MRFICAATHEIESASITATQSTFNFRTEAGYDAFLADNFAVIAEAGYRTTEHWTVEFHPQLILQTKP